MTFLRPLAVSTSTFAMALFNNYLATIWPELAFTRRFPLGLGLKSRGETQRWACLARGVGLPMSVR